MKFKVGDFLLSKDKTGPVLEVIGIREYTQCYVCRYAMDQSTVVLSMVNAEHFYRSISRDVATWYLL